LTEVERASPERINRLVDTVEDVICHEIGIWASSLSRLEEQVAQAQTTPEKKLKNGMDTE